MKTHSCSNWFVDIQFKLNIFSNFTIQFPMLETLNEYSICHGTNLENLNFNAFVLVFELERIKYEQNNTASVTIVSLSKNYAIIIKHQNNRNCYLFRWRYLYYTCNFYNNLNYLIDLFLIHLSLKKLRFGDDKTTYILHFYFRFNKVSR